MEKTEEKKRNRTLRES